MASVTVDVCTKDRYNTGLPMTLVSVALQTHKPDVVKIYDDSTNRIDIRENEVIRYALQLLDSKGIGWEVIFGSRKGQHHGHQTIQDTCTTDFVWRIDDDEIAEPNVLEILLSNMVEGVGAVAGLVLMPDAPHRECPPNTISYLGDNCQWYRWSGKKEVEHLYSSYLYRPRINRYELLLSNVAHREETLHSFGIFKKGYKLIVDGSAVTYHFRSNTGGIRDGDRGSFGNDEILFQGIMRENGVNAIKEKNFVLDEGKGDHVVFEKLVPEIREKYKDYKLNFYLAYPDVFRKHKDLDIFSIQDAYNRLGDIQRFNLYKVMYETNQKINLEQAYRKLYDI